MPAPATVKAYLAALPADRRAVMEKLLAAIRPRIDGGFEEGIQYGAIGWFVPHRLYPPGYHCDPRQPLPLGGIAARKGYYTHGFMHHYWDSAERKRFEKEWKATGKRLDMGAACIRVRGIDDVPLEVLGDSLARVTAKGYVAHYEKALGDRPHPGKKKAKAAPAKAKAKKRR